MSDASHDERILARIEAAADTMPDAPVRWERVASLARRKLLISVVAALALAVLAAVLLAYAGSYSSLKLTGTAPIALPGLAHKQLSADRSRPRASSAARPNGEPTSGTRSGHPAAGRVVNANGAGKGGAKPREIRLSLSATSVPADGKATITVTARVLDAIGRPLSGQDVRFSSGDPITERESPVSGVYVATITSSTKAGPVTVEARDGTVIARAVFQQTPVEPANACSNEAGETATTTTGSTVPTTGATPTTSTGSTTGASTTTSTATPCGASTEATTNGVSTNGASTSGSGTATQGASTQGTGTQGTTTGTNTHETDTTKAGAGTSGQSGAGGESAEVG